MRLLGGLALAQLRSRAGRWAMLVVGVALVVAIPVATAGLSRSVDAQAVRRAVARLPLAERTMLVSQEASSVRVGTRAQNDVAVRSELRRLTQGPVVHELLYRQVVVRGFPLVLSGIDRLATQTRLVSGRMPTSCTPARCEVVSLDARVDARDRGAAATLGIDVVGTVARRSPLVVSGQLETHGVTTLLGDGADAVARLRTLALFSRYYVWAASVDAGPVVSQGVPAWVARTADVNAAIERRIGSASLDAPTSSLQDAASRADASARRLSLLGGFAAVLLVGFALVAAVGLRREARLLQAVLVRRGSTGRQIWVVTVAQAIVGCALGAALGSLLGAVVAGAQAGGTGLGALGLATHALAGAGPAIAALTVGTVVVVVAVLLWPDARARPLWRVLDLLAVACVGAAFLAAGRGDTSANTLTATPDPLVTVLPILASIVAGLVAARLWGPAVRLAERMLPGRSVAGRLALLGAARRPLRPVATAAFLTAAVTAVVFAGAYRSTLLANDADQAAYRVPLDRTVAARPGLPSPVLDEAELGDGVAAYPVLRTNVSVTRLAGVVDSIPLVAPDRAALARAQRWSRTSGSDRSPAGLAGELQVAAAPAPGLPAGGHTITIMADGFDPATTPAVWLRGADGRQAQVLLHPRGTELVGALPPLAGAPTVTAVGVQQEFDHATHRAHALGEGNGSVPDITGRLDLGAVQVDGRDVPWSWAGWGSATGRVTAGPTTLALGYRIAAAAVVAVPGYAARATRALPVAVDAQTARDAHGGVLTLTVDAETVLDARVVAVLPRVPTVDGPFVLADRAAFLAALDLYEPGRNASEYWVAGTSPQLVHTLASRRFSVTAQAAIRADLDGDPVGTGARTLLLIVALLGLLVGAVSLMLLVLGERRDGAGELYAWEADGTAPGVLRRMLAVRALAVAAVAVPVGIAAGLIVARIATTLIAVSATGTRPTPGLDVTFGSAWTVLALAAGVGLGLLAAGAVAASSLRERHPVAAQADLR